MSYEYEDTARTQLLEFELFLFNTHDLREEGYSARYAECCLFAADAAKLPVFATGSKKV